MESEIDNVRAELDSLLERYLQALDDYGKARHDMHTFMSSVGAAHFLAAMLNAQGFLSLARANSISASKIRHGQDFYDYRMRALKRVLVKVDNSED
jgi:hypothetical protein